MARLINTQTRRLEDGSIVKQYHCIMSDEVYYIVQECPSWYDEKPVNPPIDKATAIKYYHEFTKARKEYKVPNIR